MRYARSPEVVDDFLVAVGLMMPSCVSPAIAATQTEHAPVLIQRVIINDILFHVPDAYRDKLDRAIYKKVRKKPRVYPRGNPGEIGLDIIYPTMRPPQPADYVRDPEAKKPTEIHEVRLGSTISNRTAGEVGMRAHRDAGNCDATSFMDRCTYSSDTSPATQKRRFAMFLGQGDEFVVCHNFTAVPNPHCEMAFILFDGVYIEIRFNRRILSDVLTVRARVFDLICGWVDMPAGGELKANRCR